MYNSTENLEDDYGPKGRNYEDDDISSGNTNDDDDYDEEDDDDDDTDYTILPSNDGESE